jgi:hypothetical protein
MFVPRPAALKFVGDPTPEIDQNWESITDGRAISTPRSSNIGSHLLMCFREIYSNLRG